MTRTVKAGFVGLGYLAALAVAFGTTAAYIASTAGPAREAAGGMYAFGDSLVFLASFSVAAVLPTGAGLYLLRGYPPFWNVLAVAGPLVAATALVAIAIYGGSRFAGDQSVLQEWSTYAILRLLLSPPLGLAFCVAGLFAPERPARNALFASTLLEAAAFGGALLRMFASY